MIHARRVGGASSGAAAAFVAGSMAVILGGATDQLRALLAEPAIVVLGLLVAAGLGAALAGKVVRAPLLDAIGIAIGYGALVPMLVAALIALPVAPIAAAFAVVAWPVTIPTALAWLALIRWGRSGKRLSSVPPAVAVVVFTTGLLVIRFTQPMATMSTATGQCLTFPGESITMIAWSPDARWLGVGSERVGEGIVRVVEQGSGRITELARSPNVDGLSGVAVGPGGATTYLVNEQGAGATEEEGAALWLASPTDAARPFAEPPTASLYDLTWTPEGIAAVQWIDSATGTETHRLVWVRPNTAPSDTIVPIAPERVADYPVLAPLVDPSGEAPMMIKTPSGERRIEWPSDTSIDVSVTTDGAFLVFHARALTADEVDEAYSHVVAQSTETGRRVVLAEGPGWEPQVAAGRLAYLTFPTTPNNSVCVKHVTE